MLAASGVLLAGCSSNGAAPRAEDPTPSSSEATSSPSKSPSPTKDPNEDIDWSAPPQYVRFDGWKVDRFPVPSGSTPKTTDGTPRDFSAYIIFKGGDLERISVFYEEVLRRAGYALDVDAYGTVRFAGDGIEGGVIEGRDEVAVVLNRAET